MTCRECRDAYDTWLNEGGNIPLQEPFRLHAESCPMCGPYTHAMHAVDGALRKAALTAPRAESLPPGLIAFADRLCELEHARHTAPHWGQYVRRAVWYVLPGLCLWLLSLAVVGTWQMAIHVTMIVACTFVLLLSPHRPRLFI